jgi:hypothetical protein
VYIPSIGTAKNRAAEFAIPLVAMKQWPAR